MPTPVYKIKRKFSRQRPQILAILKLFLTQAPLTMRPARMRWVTRPEPWEITPLARSAIVRARSSTTPNLCSSTRLGTSTWAVLTTMRPAIRTLWVVQAMGCSRRASLREKRKKTSWTLPSTNEGIQAPLTLRKARASTTLKFDNIALTTSKRWQLRGLAQIQTSLWKLRIWTKPQLFRARKTKTLTLLVICSNKTRKIRLIRKRCRTSTCCRTTVGLPRDWQAIRPIVELTPSESTPN